MPPATRPRAVLSFSTTIAPEQYHQAALAMYELPNMILAWILVLLRPRRAVPASA